MRFQNYPSEFHNLFKLYRSGWEDDKERAKKLYEQTNNCLVILQNKFESEMSYHKYVYRFLTNGEINGFETKEDNLLRDRIIMFIIKELDYNWEEVSVVMKFITHDKSTFKALFDEETASWLKFIDEKNMEAWIRAGCPIDW